MDQRVITSAAVPSAGAAPALTRETIEREFLDHLFYMQGKFPALATKRDYYMALAYVVRDYLLHRWVSTAAAYTGHAQPFEVFLLAMLLEEHKEVLRLRQEVEGLHVRQ